MFDIEVEQAWLADAEMWNQYMHAKPIDYEEE